jgi:hypothetical protein
MKLNQYHEIDRLKVHRSNRSLAPSLWLLFLTCALSHSVQAGSFIPGNLLIYRVGDGTTSLSSSATAISLLEVGTNGSVAQTIQIPTSTLTAAGSAVSEGKLRSNGQYVAVTGYTSTSGTANVSGTTDARRSLVYGLDGTVFNTLTFSGGAGSPYGGGSIRGATPNASGTAVWAVGQEGTTGTPNGVYALSGSSETQLLSGNFRSVDIFQGQLYGTTASGTDTRAFTVGMGLPVVSGQTLGSLAGLPVTGSGYGSVQMFDLDGSSGLDTLYISNSNDIEKWSLVAGTWTFNNTVTSAFSIMDFTAVWNGTAVDLYAVTASDLFHVSDGSGYNSNMSSSFSSSLLSAGSNHAFRGIDFTPIPEPSAAFLGGVGLLMLLRHRRY